MVRVTYKNVKRLSAAELDDCLELSFGNSGQMKRQMHKERGKIFTSARAYRALNESGELVSWSLVFSAPSGVTAYFFTREDSRRQGYGRAVYVRVRKDYTIHKIRVDPWDDRSRDFFTAVEAIQPKQSDYDYA